MGKRFVHQTYPIGYVWRGYGLTGTPTKKMNVKSMRIQTYLLLEVYLSKIHLIDKTLNLHI